MNAIVTMCCLCAGMIEVELNGTDQAPVTITDNGASIGPAAAPLTIHGVINTPYPISMDWIGHLQGDTCFGCGGDGIPVVFKLDGREAWPRVDGDFSQRLLSFEPGPHHYEFSVFGGDELMTSFVIHRIPEPAAAWLAIFAFTAIGLTPASLLVRSKGHANQVF